MAIEVPRIRYCSAVQCAAIWTRTIGMRTTSCGKLSRMLPLRCVPGLPKPIKSTYSIRELEKKEKETICVWAVRRKARGCAGWYRWDCIACDLLVFRCKVTHEHASLLPPPPKKKKGGKRKEREGGKKRPWNRAPVGTWDSHWETCHVDARVCVMWEYGALMCKVGWAA